MCITCKQRLSVEREQDTSGNARRHGASSDRHNRDPAPQQLYCRTVRVVVQRVHKDVGLFRLFSARAARQEKNELKHQSQMSMPGREHPLTSKAACQAGSAGRECRQLPGKQCMPLDNACQPCALQCMPALSSLPRARNECHVPEEAQMRKAPRSQRPRQCVRAVPRQWGSGSIM